MDSLKTLMDQKNYDLVIKLTENSNDAISLFYRLSALLAVGKSEDALNLIKSKRLIMQKRLALLIKFHIEILCLLKRFDEAYDELKYYEELPYESQEVEEVIRSMPAYIRNEEKIQLLRALEKLKDDYRQVLYLVYFENFSNTETAKIMGRSERQIRNILYRSKESLRKILEKEGFRYEEI